MPVGGENGPNEQYVHPVYKNMDSAKARIIDKAVAATVKNTGKASEIGKNLKNIQEDIIDLTKVRGSRTSFTTGKDVPKYRGAGGIGGPFGSRIR